MSRNLEIGSTIPDFELPDENGDVYKVSDLQGDNFLVLHLSRGEHCPRERQHHKEFLRFHELCSVAFTELVSILPNGLHDVLKLKISTGAHWTFLADEDLEEVTKKVKEDYDPTLPEVRTKYEAQKAGAPA